MKKYMALFLTAAMFLFTAAPAFAASGSSVIGSVSISFSESGEAAGVIRKAEPSVRTSDCKVTDWSCSTDYADWKIGTKVTFTVVIEPVNDKHFSKSDTKVTSGLKNAEVTSKSVASGQITAKVSYWPTTKLPNPQNALLNGDYLAKWDKVQGCSRYEVKVAIEDEKTTTKTLTADTNHIDLAEYSDEGEVSFSVRAIPKDSQKNYIIASDWVEGRDGEFGDEDDSDPFRFSSTSGSITYINGQTGASGWRLKDGRWHYGDPADSGRELVNAWGYIGGAWYHFDGSGAMQTGWLKDGNYWYFLNPTPGSDEGRMLTGWIQLGQGGLYYCLNGGESSQLPLGAMYAGTTTPGGYVVDANGAWTGK